MASQENEYLPSSHFLQQTMQTGSPAWPQLPPIQGYREADFSTPVHSRKSWLGQMQPPLSSLLTPLAQRQPSPPPQAPPTATTSQLSSLNPTTPLIVDLLAVQNVAQDFQLSETQTDMLKTFVKLGSAGQGLSKPDLLTRLFHLALTIHYENQRPKDDHSDVQTLRGIIKDLKIRLENTFSLTSDQMKNVRALAFDKIYDPLRTCYMAINADIFDYLKIHAEELHFSNVFGNPVYEQVLERAIRKTCSSVRNGFRQHLRISKS
ncbi:hypothetical protein BDP27DRAFT_1414063 [Rhodocollybia butyracea]|uniref:Uncharacterized protein n=1 Tax=Rhodocollybia butyracea TaxID=206335 RepID=A0A9P5Q942_9AGAR|nr:hypothetical protein BDP27DRAFT_1414063 [Rhodocollybia butyracea]